MNIYLERKWDITVFPKCVTDKDIRPKVLGRILEWYVLEVSVFIGYFLTMMFLMIKSRFKLIGGDQSAQFESYFMS
jgi:hypothetical protein